MGLLPGLRPCFSISLPGYTETVELIPNIRFNTALAAALLAPMLVAIVAFQPSDTVLKVMFGAYVVLLFGIGLWHSDRTMPPPPKEQGTAHGRRVSRDDSG